MTNSFSDGALLIDVALVAGLTIHVRASIDRISEHIIDGGIGRDNPTQLMAGSEGRHDAKGVQRERQTLRAETDPDLRAEPSSVNFSKMVRMAPVTASSG